MPKSHRNKENQPWQVNSKPINSFFKVQKRLFEAKKLDFTSPVLNSIQPSSPASEQDDSPYLYEMRKKAASKFCSVETSTFSQSTIDDTPLKRSGSSAKQRICLSSEMMETSYIIVEDSNDSSDVVMESPRSSAVMKIVEKVTNIEEEEVLSGDFSQKCVLPTIKGKHPELHTISPATVASLLTGNLGYDITIFDCRYPYEFKAGHIKGAINMYSKEKVDEDLFNIEFTEEGVRSNRLLLFYCEFSSERAPNMMRFVRQRDRAMNADDYPFVYYPEMYLIDGGYKSFFASFKHLCEPQSYKPMLASENSADLVYYKNICKTWNCKVQNTAKW